MRIKGSVKYKILRLVLVQAIFLIAVLMGISLISPSWVFSSVPQSVEVITTIKKIKHEYAMLNALSIKLASYRYKSHQKAQPTNAGSINGTYASTVKALSQHIDSMRELSKKGQYIFNTDFSVLISFLFNYQSQIKKLIPQQANFEENLWHSQLYFSRIQSEIFYIIEDIDQAQTITTQKALKNKRISFLIWGFASLILLVISNLITLTYINKEKD